MGRFGWTIDGYPLGDAAVCSGFNRPSAHVLFDHPPDWRISTVRSVYMSWFSFDCSEWRTSSDDVSSAAITITLDGFAIECRLLCTPSPPARFNREIANSPWFENAALVVARHRRRVFLSPAETLRDWAGAPHDVRLQAMRAMSKVTAAFALLGDASAVIWPLSETIWTPRTAALAAHDWLPSLYWVRARVHQERGLDGEPVFSAASSGLSALAGCEIAVRATEETGRRQVARTLTNLISDLVQRGPDGAEDLSRARHSWRSALRATSVGAGMSVELVR